MKQSIVIVFILFSLIVHAQKGTYDFVFPEHKSSEKPLLSLRFLNEETAGINGFIRLSDDGDELHGR